MPAIRHRLKSQPVRPFATRPASRMAAQLHRQRQSSQGGTRALAIREAFNDQLKLPVSNRLETCASAARRFARRCEQEFDGERAAAQPTANESGRERKVSTPLTRPRPNPCGEVPRSRGGGSDQREGGGNGGRLRVHRCGTRRRPGSGQRKMQSANNRPRAHGGGARIGPPRSRRARRARSSTFQESGKAFPALPLARHGAQRKRRLLRRRRHVCGARPAREQARRSRRRRDGSESAALRPARDAAHARERGQLHAAPSLPGPVGTIGSSRDSIPQRRLCANGQLRIGRGLCDDATLTGRVDL